MNKNSKKNAKWFRVVRSLSFILVVLLLITGATYAWMKREWKPTITQNNIQIAAGSSLAFVFQDQEIEEVTLNTLFGVEEYEFKSVSNISGKSTDFFTLDYGTKGIGYETYKKISLEDIDGGNLATDLQYTELGKKYGYIEMTFKVISPSGENNDKAVYITKDSKIAPSRDTEDCIKAAKAIRLSVTVHDAQSGINADTKIFSSESVQHKATTNAFDNDSGKYVADGKQYYKFDSNNRPIVDQPNADYIMTVEGTKTFNDFGSDSPLFYLKAGETKTLTVRIWLEGEDVNCNDTIAGGELDLLLQFAARNATAEEIAAK